MLREMRASMAPQKLTLGAIVSSVLRARRTIKRQPLPLNSIEQRCVLLRWLNAQLTFDCMIETGTFLGHSTAFFAELAKGKPVYSAEINRIYFGYAKKRLQGYQNIHLRHTHSVGLLQALQEECAQQSVLVYLDSHWLAHLPILEELEICLKWENAIIMIDDFRVPHDIHFHYDDYGDKGVLELDYIHSVLTSHQIDQVYFPSAYRDYPFAEKLNSPNHSQGFVLIATNPNTFKQLAKAPLLLAHPLQGV